MGDRARFPLLSFFLISQPTFVFVSFRCFLSNRFLSLLEPLKHVASRYTSNFLFDWHRGMSTSLNSVSATNVEIIMRKFGSSMGQMCYTAGHHIEKPLPLLIRGIRVRAWHAELPPNQRETFPRTASATQKHQRTSKARQMPRNICSRCASHQYTVVYLSL